MSEPTPEQSKQLEAYHADWRQAQARLEMVQQTLAGAQTDVLAKQARFKGAAELFYGADATFTYDEKAGLTFVLPNREQRRALAKARKKK